jgi:hypothetical protein
MERGSDDSGTNKTRADMITLPEKDRQVLINALWLAEKYEEAAMSSIDPACIECARAIKRFQKLRSRLLKQEEA